MLKESLAVLVCLVGVANSSTFYKVIAEGHLHCNGKPVPDYPMELWEYDTPDPDDHFDSKKTNEKGYFLLKGEEAETEELEPYLYIKADPSSHEPGYPCKDYLYYGVHHNATTGNYEERNFYINICECEIVSGSQVSEANLAGG